MSKLLLSVLSILLILPIKYSIAQVDTVSSFEEFMSLAEAKSLTIKSGEIQLTQAKKAKLVAILGIIDPTGGISLTYINNTQLPVSLIPSEVLGGQAGTFQEVKFGVKYNTTYNTNIDIKLLNLTGWKDFKLAKLNIQLTENNNKLAIKNLHENSAVIFFNIATLLEQLKSTIQHLETAEKLHEVALNKQKAGLANQQDLNESIINKKSLEEQINQINFILEQQYSAIKILCDIPKDVQFVIVPQKEKYTNEVEVSFNQLLIDNALLKEQISLNNYKKAKYAFFPTISFFASFSEQQLNTRATLFDSNINWIPSSYVGIRLSMPLPSSASIAQSFKTKYDYSLSKNSTEKLKIQSFHHQTQLITEYQKAVSLQENHKLTYELRKDTYEKNLINYEAGILSLEPTLRSFNEMINSHYELISAEKVVEMAIVKININNNMN